MSDAMKVNIVVVLVGLLGFGAFLHHQFSDDKPERAQARCAVEDNLPDPDCTPGAADPAVTAKTVARTVCRDTYVQDIKGLTDADRALVTEAYGADADAVVVHALPVELGGAVGRGERVLDNAFPLPAEDAGAHKDAARATRREVCANKVRLARAQVAFVRDWQR